MGANKFASVFSQTCYVIEPKEKEMLPSLKCFTNNFSKDLFWNGTVTLKKMYSLAFEVESFSPDRRMEHQVRESNKQFLISQQSFCLMLRNIYGMKKITPTMTFTFPFSRCFGLFEVWMVNCVSRTVSSQTALTTSSITSSLKHHVLDKLFERALNLMGRNVFFQSFAVLKNLIRMVCVIFDYWKKKHIN